MYDIGLTLTHPMYFFVHIEPDTQISRCYWSKDPEPLKADEVDMALQAECEGLYGTDMYVLHARTMTEQC